MAALPPEMGVDPETMDPMAMPQEEMPVDPGVDPGQPPPDPMLQQEPVEEELPYGGMQEVEYREKVELCVLGAIENAAKAVEVGIGSDNPQFAQAFGQAAASLGQCYEALTRSEQAEKDDEPFPPEPDVGFQFNQ